MSTYGVTFLSLNRSTTPDIVFMSENDMTACEIAHSLAMEHKVVGYDVFKKTTIGWQHMQ